MVFSTILFVFRFLPITLALYYLAPGKWKNTALFLCSLIFYSWGEVRLFPVMAAAILINYTAGLGMEKFAHSQKMRKAFLIYSIVGSLGMLGFFKYTNFFIDNINALTGAGIGTLDWIVLPLGISFYTFQTMSYAIDVYRGDVETEHNIIDFGAYVVMFPQLIAGPIVKYRDVSDRLHIYHGRVTLDRVDEGISLFIFGLRRKCSWRTASRSCGTTSSARRARRPSALRTPPRRWCGWASSPMRSRSISTFRAIR